MLSSSSRSRKQYSITETAPISMRVRAEPDQVAGDAAAAPRSARGSTARAPASRGRAASRPTGERQAVRLRARGNPSARRAGSPAATSSARRSSRCRCAGSRSSASAETTVLAVELEHQPQHAVRAGVLRPHVDGHRLGANSGMRLAGQLGSGYARSRRCQPGLARSASQSVSTSSQIAWISVRCTSCTRAVRASGTFTCTSASAPTAPPSRPVSATVVSPARRAASSAGEHVRRRAARRDADRDVARRARAPRPAARTRARTP